METTLARTRLLESEATTEVDLLNVWFDPIETALRDCVCEFNQAMIDDRGRARGGGLPPALWPAGRRRKRSVPMGEAMSPATGMATDRAL